MKGVFGLGNPGLEYGLTRHNVGFQVVDLYRNVHRLRAKGTIADRALVYRTGDLLLVKPLTFMNDSGRAVQGVLSRFDLSVRDVLVVFDDLDLPLGRMRVLAAGGAGTHKGMRSVLDALGTEEIPRLRIGIGPDAPRADAVDYVLDRFSEEEWLRLVPVLRDAVEAIDLYREGSIEVVMNRYNPRPRSIETDPDAAII